METKKLTTEDYKNIENVFGIVREKLAMDKNSVIACLNLEAIILAKLKSHDDFLDNQVK